MTWMVGTDLKVDIRVNLSLEKKISHLASGCTQRNVAPHGSVAHLWDRWQAAAMGLLTGSPTSSKVRESHFLLVANFEVLYFSHSWKESTFEVSS